jgi:hypothetical protein
VRGASHVAREAAGASLQVARRARGQRGKARGLSPRARGPLGVSVAKAALFPRTTLPCTPLALLSLPAPASCAAIAKAMSGASIVCQGRFEP